MKCTQIVLFRLMIATAFCALSCGAPGLAQQAGASAGAGASVNASGSAQGNSLQQEGHASSGANAQAGKHSASGSATGSANGDAAASMSQVPAELTTKLDSKTAKAGDAVEAKTTKTVKTAQGVVIPKGSKLLGTVTEAKAHQKGQSQSMLALTFDRVQLRNGQEMALHSTIDNLSSSNALRASEGADEMMSPGPIGGGGSAGAGLVGGGGWEAAAWWVARSAVPAVRWARRAADWVAPLGARAARWARRRMALQTASAVPPMG